MSKFTSLLSKIDRIFPAPRYLTFDPVAIDISPTKVRLMKLHRGKEGLVPKIYKEVDLKTKYDLAKINDKKDLDPESSKELVSVLKRLKEEFKFKYVVMSLPELKTYIFRTQLPKESAGDIASSIRYGVEENVPLKVTDVNFDYSVIKKDSKGVDVVVNVFPQKVISVYTELLKSAGLFPYSFQSESVALSKAVIVDGDKDPYLLIRLLEDKVNIAIVEDNVVQYASSIDVSTKEISKDYGSSVDATNLREALNKLLIFWFTNKDGVLQHKKIQTAYVSGDYATTVGMQEFLERHLKINVEIANVWANCFSTSDYIPVIDQEQALGYAVAIGLAIREIKHA